MIGMTGEEFFNAPAIERQLIFDSKDTRTGSSASAAPELRTKSRIGRTRSKNWNRSEPCHDLTNRLNGRTSFS
jgi:hypothetical protein